VKLIEYHKAFLTNTVDLNQTRLDLLAARVDSIYAALGLDETLGPIIEDVIPQGSWAHRTIIKPLAGREYDADVLLQLTEQASWSDDPRKYIDQTEAALLRSRDYSDKTEKHTRCVRVIYADDCHVDVVPHLVLTDDRGVIVNRTDNVFEDSDPAGFTDWMKDKDDLANRNLRKVIRLLKYLRDFKGTFSVPSVILTTLVGERIQAFDTASRYSDIPTALRNVLADLDGWLQLNPIMPTIEDPSCPGVSFNHRWDEARYATFRTKIHDYSAWVSSAYDEPDRATSLALWQKVFGPDFKAPVTALSESLAKSAAAPAVAPGPREQFIEDRFPIRPRYVATIDARVRFRAGFRSGPLRDMGTVGLGRSLAFALRTDTPRPYELFWKVRNLGQEAADAQALRGEITADDGDNRRTESTAYRGDHYVEAYVVKGGAVVASDHHRVRIR
jgi:Adenylyl/Guanylyl and SMODS C-terminal sensor domain/Second Messenger Oligonucleotide or Dinucleotide Synthetase domain